MQRSLSRWAIAPAILCSTISLFPQGNILSPEVHPDRRITLRLHAPNAQSVLIRGLEAPQMIRDSNGVWSATTGALEPEIYSYRFEVDGTSMIDPRNREVKKWFTLESLVEVPGNPPRLHELQNVPHGVVHQHHYFSSTAQTIRSVRVYTPPGYNPRSRKKYPALFLLHGFGDDETAWTEVGRAHCIADNLLAKDSIKPMLIIMPNGHPLPVGPGQRFQDYAPRNRDLLETDVVQDLIPLLETHYAISRQARDRAIVGLSMGGGQSLGIGLSRLDLFAWVGGFSSAAPEGDLEKQFAPLLTAASSSRSRDLRLLWIGCGEKDFLLERNQAFVTWLQEHRIPHTYRLSEGGHEWAVWRRYLAEFLPLVF